MAEPDVPRLTAREAAALDELDEQRARAEAAEHQLDQARAAVRDGDWHALWAALGIAATQRLPEMHTALDTAAELAAETGLTAEQEIRAEAIADATRCLQGALTRHGDLVAANIVGVAALALAETFESYIRYGDADDPEPDEAERLRTGEICQPGQPFACGDYHHAGHCVRPSTPDTKPATRHFSPNCACGINDAGERVVDPICARLSTEAGDG